MIGWGKLGKWGLKAAAWTVDNWLVVIAGLLVTHAALLSWQLNRAERARDQAELVLVNERARTSETIRVWLDSQAYWYRMALQVPLGDRDSLDRAIGVEEPRARATVTITVPEAEELLEGGPVEEDAEGVRSAVFQSYSEPFHLWAQAFLPPPNDTLTPTLHTRLAIDPIRLDRLVVGCGEPEEGERVRPALVGFHPPSWAELEVAEVQVAPDVCNRDLLDAGGGGGLNPGRLAATGGIGAVLGAAIHAEDRTEGAWQGLVGAGVLELARQIVLGGGVR